MTDLDQSPAQQYELVAEGPTEGWVKDYAAEGGGGNPGGATTQLQYNDGGLFGGDSRLVWDKVSGVLSVSGVINNGGVALYGGFYKTQLDNNIIIQKYSNDSTGADTALLKSRSPSKGNKVALQDGDAIGQYTFYGTSNINNITAGYISVTVKGAVGDTSLPSRMAFGTNPGAIGADERLSIEPLGSVVVGTAAIATNANDGYLYVPGCEGTPTGVPQSFTGRVPLVVDITNNKLYFYTNGAWRDAGP